MKGMSSVSKTLLLGAFLLLRAVPAIAEVVRPAPDAPAAAAAAFVDLWLAEDHEGLAAALAEGGADITLGPAASRDRRTSPAQAHYLFKTTFQATHDHSLETESVVEGEDGVSAHAVLDWRYRRGDALVRERLFLSLAFVDDAWRVVTLSTGR